MGKNRHAKNHCRKKKECPRVVPDRKFDEDDAGDWAQPSYNNNTRTNLQTDKINKHNIDQLKVKWGKLIGANPIGPNVAIKDGIAYYSTTVNLFFERIASDPLQENPFDAQIDDPSAARRAPNPNQIYAVDLETGYQIWTSGDFFPRHGVFWNTVMLTVSCDKLLVAVGLVRDNSSNLKISSDLYALDRFTGSVLWQYRQEADPEFLTPIPAYGFADPADVGPGNTNVFTFPMIYPNIVGAPTVVDGKVFIPVANDQETYGSKPDFGVNIVNAQGMITILDFETGDKIRSLRLDPENKFSPGGGIWQAVSVDVKQKIVYASTGNAYIEPRFVTFFDEVEGVNKTIFIDASPTSDAIVAWDYETGELLWSSTFRQSLLQNQVTGVWDVISNDFWAIDAQGVSVEGSDYDVSSVGPCLIQAKHPCTGKCVKLIAGGGKSGERFLLDAEDPYNRDKQRVIVRQKCVLTYFDTNRETIPLPDFAFGGFQGNGCYVDGKWFGAGMLFSTTPTEILKTRELAYPLDVTACENAWSSLAGLTWEEAGATAATLPPGVSLTDLIVVAYPGPTTLAPFWEAYYVKSIGSQIFGMDIEKALRNPSPINPILGVPYEPDPELLNPSFIKTEPILAPSITSRSGYYPNAVEVDNNYGPDPLISPLAAVKGLLVFADTGSRGDLYFFDTKDLKLIHTDSGAIDFLDAHDVRNVTCYGLPTKYPTGGRFGGVNIVDNKIVSLTGFDIPMLSQLTKFGQVNPSRWYDPLPLVGVGLRFVPMQQGSIIVQEIPDRRCGKCKCRKCKCRKC